MWGRRVTQYVIDQGANRHDAAKFHIAGSIGAATNMRDALVKAHAVCGAFLSVCTFVVADSLLLHPLNRRRKQRKM